MGSHQQNGAINRPAVAEVVVVVVPFVAHGHLNQLLHLSRLISSYNIPVHFVTTTTHIRQLHSRHQNFDNRPTPTTAPIQFHDFPIPPFTSPLPNHSNRFPCHLQPAFDSTFHLRPHLAALVLSLSATARRVAVVHDFLVSYVVQDVRNIPNAETYIFNPLSACATFWIEWERLGKPFPMDSGILKRVPSSDGTFSPEFTKLVALQYPHADFHIGELFDSSRAIEGEYLEYLQRNELKGTKKLWAIGPVNRGKNSLATVSENRHKCLQWLDLQPPNSVVYVSFGTTTTFSDEQIKELAVGLERSQQRFVWVARAADKGDVFCDEGKMAECFPVGFERAVEGRGLVVREWAPQLEILGHLATSGFMSHCGWNSTTESISNGMPMITWPMHSDQPWNAFLITDVLRIGLAVYDWEHRDELVTSVVVEDLVRRIIDSKEGGEMRKRAAELADSVRRSVADGGVSGKEIDSFISYINREG